MKQKLLSKAEGLVRHILSGSDSKVQAIGYRVVIFLVFVIFVWGTIAPLQSAALAPGIVQVEGKRKAVQHLEGGIVDTIFVSNGEYVAKGQTLLQMDTTQAGAELQIVGARRFSLLAQVNRLSAERDGQESIQFSAELLENIGADQRAEDAIAAEATLFEARRLSLLGEAEVLQQRVVQLREKLAGLQAIGESKALVAESLEGEINDLNELLKKGYVDKQRLRELQRLRSNVLGEIADSRAQIAATKVAIGETKLQILQLNKNFKTEVVDLHKQASANLYDIEQQYAAIQDRFERATVRAPEPGYVLDLVTTTAGAVVPPGEILMEIVPSVESMVVDARISPMDIDRVKIGQPAEIRFAVFKDAYSVGGELIKVSPDRLIDAASGIPYYSAEIVILDKGLLIDEGMELIPGMPAEVLIKTGERTMLGYITSPINRLFSRSLIED